MLGDFFLISQKATKIRSTFVFTACFMHSPSGLSSLESVMGF